MGYKALITLDLPSASEKQRDEFYDYLKKNQWSKIKGPTTAWIASFKDEVTKENAISILKRELKEAKVESKTPRVEYALQLNTSSVVVETI